MYCEGSMDWCNGEFQCDKHAKAANNSMAALVAVLKVIRFLFFANLSLTNIRMSIHCVFIQKEVGVQNGTRISLCFES